MEFNGKTFRSKKELADHYGVSAKKLRWRLSNGWTIEEALELQNRPHHQAQAVSIGDLSFSTKNEAAAHFGIPFSRFQARLKRGWTYEEALGLVDRVNTKKGPRKPHLFLGVKFDSISERDQYFGLNTSTIEKRLHRGWTEEQAAGLSAPPTRFRTKSGKARSHSWREIVEIGGKFYPKGAIGDYKLYVISNSANHKEYVGVTISDLQTRLRGHFSEALRDTTDTKIARAIRKYGKEKFTINLIRNDAENFAELERQEIQEIKKRNSVKLGYNISKGGHLANSKPIVVDGKQFASQSSAAEAYGIDPNLFNLRLASGKSPEQAVGILPRQPYENISIVTQGGSWATLKQACEELGLNYKTVHRRITVYNYSIEEALELRKNPKLKKNNNPIKFRNMEFKSQAAFAKYLNVSPSTICKLLKSISVAEIVKRFRQDI